MRIHETEIHIYIHQFKCCVYCLHTLLASNQLPFTFIKTIIFQYRYSTMCLTYLQLRIQNQKTKATKSLHTATTTKLLQRKLSHSGKNRPYIHTNSFSQSQRLDCPQSRALKYVNANFFALIHLARSQKIEKSIAFSLLFSLTHF